MTDKRENNNMYDLNVQYGDYGRILSYDLLFTDPINNISQQVRNSSYVYPPLVGNCLNHDFVKIYKITMMLFVP